MASKADLIGIRAAAQLLGVHPNTMRAWGASGRISEVRVGPRNDRRYSRTEIERVKASLDDGAITGGPDARFARLVADGGAAQALRGYQELLDSPGIRGMLQQFAQANSLVKSMAMPDLASMRVIGAMLELTAPVGLLSQQLEEMIRPSSSLMKQIADSIQLASRPEIETFFRSQEGIAARLAEISRVMQPAYAANLLEISGPASRAFRELDGLVLSAPSPSLATLRAALVSTSFQEFTDEVAESLPVEPSEAQSGLAVGQFEVGAQVLDNAVAGLASLVGYSVAQLAADDGAINVFRFMLVTTVRRRPQLLGLSAAEIARELSHSLPARISDAANRLVRARSQCVKTAELLGLEPIFSASVETEDAAAALALHVADDEDGLSKCVNRLYKLIYESSGELNRVSDEFKSSESDFFVLKNLRTYYFHDVRHGEQRKQQKKLAEVADGFRRLISQPIPRTPSDFLNAQLSLFMRLADLLDEIEASLRARAANA
jgi:hypothetical protein